MKDEKIKITNWQTQARIVNECECNECGFVGELEEFEIASDEEGVLICPVCGSENIYQL